MVDMKTNEYKIITDCIEKGIDCGFTRAHKHTDNPSEESLKNEIYDAIMLEICEYFTFPENEYGTRD
jgi:hypothetical protein